MYLQMSPGTPALDTLVERARGRVGVRTPLGRPACRKGRRGPRQVREQMRQLMEWLGARSVSRYLRLLGLGAA